MAVISAILAGLATYFVLYEILFEDREEFVKKLKDFVVWSPVRAFLDYSSEKESLRIWLWGSSGLLIGILVYVFSAIVDLANKVALTNLMPT